MLFIVLLGLGIAYASTISAGQNKTSVVMCGSFSCAYNKRARCTRKEIAIYDNTVLGLCLYHTEMMGKRIIEPMNKAIVVERSKPNPQMINKIMKAQEEIKDSELVKNPKAFAKWIREQGIGKNKR